MKVRRRHRFLSRILPWIVVGGLVLIWGAAFNKTREPFRQLEQLQKLPVAASAPTTAGQL